jgi:hypothetical protein
VSLTVTNSANDTVQICAWCPTPKILSLVHTQDDAIEIHREPFGVTRNGEPLRISHGICPACAKKEAGQ